jgi:hypothetical protein
VTRHSPLMSMAILMNIGFSFADVLLPLCRRQGEGAVLLDRSYARFCHGLSAARTGDLRAG